MNFPSSDSITWMSVFTDSRSSPAASLAFFHWSHAPMPSGISDHVHLGVYGRAILLSTASSDSTSRGKSSETVPHKTLISTTSYP